MSADIPDWFRNHRVIVPERQDASGEIPAATYRKLSPEDLDAYNVSRFPPGVQVYEWVDGPTMTVNLQPTDEWTDIDPGDD